MLDPDQRLDGRLDETARAIETHPWFGYHKMTVAGVANKTISPCLMPASENSFQPNMGGINFTRTPQPNTTSTNVLDDVSTLPWQAPVTLIAESGAESGPRNH